MKGLPLFFLCLSITGTTLFADSVYTLDLKKDIIIGSAALGLFVPALILEPSAGETHEKSDINVIDRSLMFSYNKPLDVISTAAGITALVLPGISVIENIRDKHVLATYGIMYAEAFLLTHGTKDLLKYFVARNRPYTYSGGIPSGEEDDYFNSFPSGHTAYAFLGATFLSVTFSAEYPDSKWKIPIIAGSYTIAAGVGMMRIFSGNHFLTDVLTGACIGSLYGWLIPRLHLRKDGTGVSFQPLPGGMIVSLSF
ncbi:phosphatase PAP2 family protein [Treponema sp. OttesenSCG-928-L16]|nr:phosphatase PAP2 family protein [Treponema sp. OttesenSCG-928-L16]